MYLSRIELDVSKRDTQVALISKNKLHGAVKASLIEENNRVMDKANSKHLWRIDTLRGRTYLLILSSHIPDLSFIQHQFGYEDKEGETKEYDKLLNRIEKDSVWNFRLVANPTYSKKAIGKDGRGKVIAHTTTKYQLEWLKAQSEKRGFKLEEDSFNVVGSNWEKFIKRDKFKEKSGKKVSVLKVTFEGKLKVEDVDIFKDTLVNGIGRGKAYGMGLLTIVR